MTWIFVGLGLLVITAGLSFFFFAGSRRSRRIEQRIEYMPAGGIDVLSPPIEPWADMAGSADTIDKPSYLCRVVHFFGYQEAKLEKKKEEVETSRPVKRARLAYHTVKVLGLKTSSKLVMTGWKIKHAVGRIMPNANPLPK